MNGVRRERRWGIEVPAQRRQCVMPRRGARRAYIKASAGPFKFRPTCALLAQPPHTLKLGKTVDHPFLQFSQTLLARPDESRLCVERLQFLGAP